MLHVVAQHFLTGSGDLVGLIWVQFFGLENDTQSNNVIDLCHRQTSAILFVHVVTVARRLQQTPGFLVQNLFPKGIRLFDSRRNLNVL